MYVTSGHTRSAGLSKATEELLAAADRGLRDAASAQRPGDRYAAAHLAALRAAAALLSARGRPNSKRRVRSVWVLLSALAPELHEWAAFFASGATRRAAAEAGLNIISQREADDLLRDAGTFVSHIASLLGVPRQLDLRDTA